MPQNKIEIVVAARDMVSGVLGHVSKATRVYRKTLQDLNGTASETTHVIRNMVVAIGGYRAVTEAIGTGMRFNANIEESRIGIAGLMFSMNAYKDAAGAALEGQAAFDAALSGSKAVQDQLRIAGLKTAATYEQLTKAFSQSYVPAVRAGFDDKQIVKFTSAVTQAATAMRVPLDMLGEEVRSILTGSMTARSTLLMPLMESAGLTNVKIRELAESGKLYTEVMKALEGATLAAGAASATLSVKWSNLKDYFSQGMGTGLAGSFEAIKDLITDITERIATVDEAAGTIEWNPAFLSTVSAVDEKLTGLINGVENLSGAILDFQKAHPVLTEVAADIGGIVVWAGVAMAATRTLGGVMTMIKALALANVAYVTTLFGGLTSLLSGLSLSAIAAGGAMAALGAAAGVAIAGFAGWKLGEWISDWEIAGMKVGEHFQAWIAWTEKLNAKIAFMARSVSIHLLAIASGVKNALTIIVHEILAAAAKIPGVGGLAAPLADITQASAERARAALSGLSGQIEEAMAASRARRDKEIAFQDDIIDGIRREAEARHAAAATEAAERLNKEAAERAERLNKKAAEEREKQTLEAIESAKAIAEADKKALQERLSAYEAFYRKIQEKIRENAREERKHVEELNALYSQQADIRRSTTDLVTSLQVKTMTPLEEYRTRSEQLGRDFADALRLNGQDQVKALETYKQDVAALARQFSEGIARDAGTWGLSDIAVTGKEITRQAIADIQRAADEQQRALSALADEKYRQIKADKAWADSLQQSANDAAGTIEYLGGLIEEVTAIIDAADRTIEIDVDDRATDAADRIRMAVDALHDKTITITTVHRVIEAGTSVVTRNVDDAGRKVTVSVDGSFSAGTMYVPKTGPYIVHEGEIVMNRAMSDALRGILGMIPAATGGNAAGGDGAGAIARMVAAPAVYAGAGNAASTFAAAGASAPVVHGGFVMPAAAGAASMGRMAATAAADRPMAFPGYNQPPAAGGDGGMRDLAAAIDRMSARMAPETAHARGSATQDQRQVVFNLPPDTGGGVTDWRRIVRTQIIPELREAKVLN